MIKKYIGYIQECHGALLLPDRCAGSEIHPAVKKKNHRLFSDGERYMHSSLYFYKL